MSSVEPERSQLPTNVRYEVAEVGSGMSMGENVKETAKKKVVALNELRSV